MESTLSKIFRNHFDFLPNISKYKSPDLFSTNNEKWDGNIKNPIGK